MRTRFKVILRIIFVLIIIGLVILLISMFKGNESKETYKVINKIPNYNYNLEDRDSLVMEETFNKLKDVLKEDEIDYQLYAEYLSSLFIIDLFTMSNKDNKYDVGGCEYVYEPILENYKLNVEETLYKYLSEDEQNTYSTVKSIESVLVEDTKYTYDKKEYDAYKVSLTWNYLEDLGYYTSGEVILIKDNNKLHVVAFKGVEVS